MDQPLRLATITFYPVKSMRGQDLPAAGVTPRGLENDRLLMVTDPRGMFYTQRNLPRLAAVVPHLEGASLTLFALGMEPLSLRLAHARPTSRVTIWYDEAEAV